MKYFGFVNLLYLILVNDLGDFVQILETGIHLEQFYLSINKER